MTVETALDPRDEMVTYISDLRAFARSLSRNATEADDLVQEAIMKAWANIDRFRPGTNMKAWLFTILRNTFYSDMRKKKWEVEDVDGIQAGRLGQKPAHDGVIALKEFRSAFLQLPHDQREALVLVGASGFSYEEAAALCDCAVGTIKSRVNRARRRLTELLQLEDGEDVVQTDRATLSALGDVKPI